MIFYVLVGFGDDEAIDLYPSRELADQALAAVLADEPAWCGQFRIEPVDLSGADFEPSLN